MGLSKVPHTRDWYGHQHVLANLMVQLVCLEGCHKDFSRSLRTSVCRWGDVARQQSQAWGGWKWKRGSRKPWESEERAREETMGRGVGSEMRLKDNNRNPGLEGEEENEGWKEKMKIVSVHLKTHKISPPKIPPSFVWFRSWYSGCL